MSSTASSCLRKADSVKHATSADAASALVASLSFIQEKSMKIINIVTLALVIVGGLNWGLVGLFNFDLVAALFGAGSVLAGIVYVLVGVSAAYQLVPLFSSMSDGRTVSRTN
jgi:uncharacterized protein